MRLIIEIDTDGCQAGNRAWEAAFVLKLLAAKIESEPETDFFGCFLRDSQGQLVGTAKVKEDLP